MSVPSTPMQPRPKRSKPKLIVGIVLTVIGGLALLARLSTAARGTSDGPSNPGEALGYLIGTVLVILIPLVVGIVLIVKSKRKA